MLAGVPAGGRLGARLAGDSCRQSKPEGVSGGFVGSPAAPVGVALGSLLFDEGGPQSNPADVSRGCLGALAVLVNPAP